MFGLFSLFGRTTAIDSALREAGIHPVLVPEAVKLTIIRMHKPEGEDRRSEPSYADRAEDCIEAAIVAGNSADAKLILLALHSVVIADEIADQLDVVDNS